MKGNDDAGAGGGKTDFSSEYSCLGKTQPDEPIFVLRAQDLFAADLVELWSFRAEKCAPDGKVAEAREIAKRMRQWAKKNGGKFPD